MSLWKAYLCISCLVLRKFTNGKFFVVQGRFKPPDNNTTALYLYMFLLFNLSWLLRKIFFLAGCRAFHHVLSFAPSLLFYNWKASVYSGLQCKDRPFLTERKQIDQTFIMSCVFFTLLNICLLALAAGTWAATCNECGCDENGERG